MEDDHPIVLYRSPLYIVPILPVSVHWFPWWLCLATGFWLIGSPFTMVLAYALRYIVQHTHDTNKGFIITVKGFQRSSISSSPCLTIHKCPNVLSPLRTNKPRPSLQKWLHANIDFPMSVKSYPHPLIVNITLQLSKLQPITLSSKHWGAHALQIIHVTESHQCWQCSCNPAMSASIGAGPWEPYLLRWILQCRLCI